MKKIRCLFCNTIIKNREPNIFEEINNSLGFPAIDYPENQFCSYCFNRIEEFKMIVASRIERKKNIIISESVAYDIASLKYGI